ncbi:MAG TPA: lysophospholipid acyltransferase family protein [Rhizobacter sp.]|nr:lysophospholipid acyltransferase family protein [Rhizobacter sp.]
MLRTLRGLWRLGWCVLRIGAGLLRCALIFPFIGPDKRMEQTGRWCAQMARALGMEVEGSGVPHAGPVLLVANHISWLDILAINAVSPARFVSKADVRHWPVLGWLVACGGTLFIERERKRDALRVVHQIADALTRGDTVAMFPEGTTGDGSSLLPFHANLLQSAVSTRTPVQPVALSYADADSQPSRAVVWVGDTTLVSSLWQVVRARRLRVRVALLPALSTAEHERRELSDLVRGRIAAELAFGEKPAAAH